jgi:hypothetical protein
MSEPIRDRLWRLGQTRIPRPVKNAARFLAVAVPVALVVVGQYRLAFLFVAFGLLAALGALNRR